MHNLLMGAAEREDNPTGEMLTTLLKALPEVQYWGCTRAEYIRQKTSANIPPIILPVNFKAPLLGVRAVGFA